VLNERFYNFGPQKLSKTSVDNHLLFLKKSWLLNKRLDRVLKYDNSRDWGLHGGSEDECTYDEMKKGILFPQKSFYSDFKYLKTFRKLSRKGRYAYFSREEIVNTFKPLPMIMPSNIETKQPSI